MFKTEAALIWSSLEVLLGEKSAQNAYVSGGKAIGLIGSIRQIARLPQEQYEREITNRDDFHLLKSRDPPQRFEARQLYEYCRIAFQISESLDQEKFAKSLEEIVTFSSLQ